MGLCVDVGHTTRAGKDVVQEIADAGPRACPNAPAPAVAADTGHPGAAGPAAGRDVVEAGRDHAARRPRPRRRRGV